MNSTTSRNDTPLEKLMDTGLELADPAQDIRGRKVIDESGVEIGHVTNLFIDRGERRVRMLAVRVGGFLGIGEHHVLIPVDAVTSVTKHEVKVNESRDRVTHSPMYDPLIVDTPFSDYWTPYYDYYGVSPYWGVGYRYPNFGMWV